MSRDEKSSYYDAGGIETLDIVRAKLTPEQYVGYLLGTALVYQCRLNFKGQAASDAHKAANYSVWLAEELRDAQEDPARGAELIAAERREQIEKHGFDASHDNSFHHQDGEMLGVAQYLLSGGCCHYPPEWNEQCKEKMDKKSWIDKLVVAGALIAAEIDRLLRKQRGK